MVCKERAEALLQNHPLSFFDNCLLFSYHYSRLTVPVTVLFFVTIMFDEVRPKVLCIHTKLIIVCRRVQAVKKSETALSLYVCRVYLRSKNSKDVLFRSIMISLEKRVLTWQFLVNKVIKFGPCWKAPYLWLVTYWQKMVGGIQKHRLL